MSKFNLSGAVINSTNLHIGDNYYYSPQDFVNKNTHLSLTKEEADLVNIIFNNTTSNEERYSLLESLKSLKSKETSKEGNKVSMLSFQSLLKQLIKIGDNVAGSVIANYLMKIAKRKDLVEFVNGLLQG